MFLLLKELLQPDGLPAPTHPLGRGVFNETPSPNGPTINYINHKSHTAIFVQLRNIYRFSNFYLTEINGNKFSNKIGEPCLCSIEMILNKN